MRKQSYGFKCGNENPMKNPLIAKKVSLALTGKKQSKELVAKRSKALKGKSYEQLYGKEKADKIKVQRSKLMLGKNASLKSRIKMSMAKTKEKEFTGFRTIIRKRIMLMREYLKWRSDIFKRDNYHCQNCGKQGYLEAHHIFSCSIIIKTHKIKTISDARKCKELWDIGNGITYCRKCHILISNNIGIKLEKQEVHNGNQQMDGAP